MPDKSTTLFAEAIEKVGKHEKDVYVEISYDVIQLLSDHLYSSPLKAIEELMVNAWDADADECRIVIPARERLLRPDDTTLIAVWDDGVGMNGDELSDLWHVGTSHKREMGWRAKRKQIGKFGIGKLATYVIARRVTYVTRREGIVRGLTLDYERFTGATRSDGTTDSVKLDQRTFEDPEDLTNQPPVAAALEGLGLDAKTLLSTQEHWTLVVLEALKPKAGDIQLGRLNWVLRTALPITDEFKLLLNNDPVESAKEDADWLVDFAVAEIEEERLKSLRTGTGENWRVERGALVSDHFANGINGRVRVSATSLYREAAKSEDLGRSHGFFIRVRERLINQSDPLFGLKPLSFETFNRFIAQIDADDLDEDLTAPRDDVQQTPAKEHFRDVLSELFNQARSLAEKAWHARDADEKQRREGERTYVNTRLLERPLTDALVGHRSHGGDPKEWLLLRTNGDETAIDQLVDELNQNVVPRRRYTYRYSNRTKAARLVEFDPEESAFTINLDHELVLEYGDKFESRRLLELLVTAEALLEVYLREFEVDEGVIAQLIERRDELLRSLAKDEQYSLKALAQALRDAVDDEKDLEVAVVGAARALGFVARHISFGGEPDGLATYSAQGRAGKTFTLEAKSSGSVPSLGSLDFAGLHSHVVAHKADGCMVVAPSYPGSTKKDDAEAALRAGQQKVSCWTVEQLARVVELAEARHITAEDIQRIVFNAFTPDDVAAQVDRLLSEPTWIQEDLRRNVIEALDHLQDRLPDSPRTIDTIAGVLTTKEGFDQASRVDIAEALNQLAKTSKGMLYVAEDGEVFVRGAMDELRRRVASLTGESAAPRRQGTLRDRGTTG
jgi:hypothetical protein